MQENLTNKDGSKYTSIKDDLSFFDGDITKALIWNSLLQHIKDRYTEQFKIEFKQLHETHAFHLSEAIKALEVSSPKNFGTRKETKFKKGRLKGLWHKHYFEGFAGIINNLKEVLHGNIRECNLTAEKTGKRPLDIDQLIDRSIRENKPDCPENIDLSPLFDAFHMRRKANKSTGEWIVYHKHLEKNYYLCLGRHGNGDGSIYEDLANKIEAILSVEFPNFLNELPYLKVDT